MKRKIQNFDENKNATDFKNSTKLIERKLICASTNENIDVGSTNSQTAQQSTMTKMLTRLIIFHLSMDKNKRSTPTYNFFFFLLRKSKSSQLGT